MWLAKKNVYAITSRLKKMCMQLQLEKNAHICVYMGVCCFCKLLLEKTKNIPWSLKIDITFLKSTHITKTKNIFNSVSFLHGFVCKFGGGGREGRVL